MTALQIVALIAAMLEQASKVAPIAIKTASDLKPILLFLYESFTGKVPTPEEVASLEAHIDAMSDELQEPLPPADEEDV